MSYRMPTTQRASLTAGAHHLQAYRPRAVSASARRVVTAAAAKPKLYSNPRSRSQLVDWYIREIGADVDHAGSRHISGSRGRAALANTSHAAPSELNMQAGDHKKEKYLALHPFGKVPALECADGTPVFGACSACLLVAQPPLLRTTDDVFNRRERCHPGLPG